MRNNITIYEYTRNVLHGKMALCDNEWMTIGSYNVNDLSAYASIELNLDVQDPKFIKKTQLMLQEIVDNDCVLITREHLATTINIGTKLRQWLAYNIIRLAFNMTTFYYRRQKK
jgi:cardiolipin synthase